MEKVEEIRKAASELLIVREVSGRSERWLWDRACRIVRHVEAICRLPGFQSKPPLDLPALTAAGYLADAGLPVYAQSKEIPFSHALLELGRPELREFSIQAIQEKLARTQNQELVSNICLIISESDSRATRLAEARILSDARNLEDLGMVGIIHDIRRCLLHGKGVSAILESWKRKIDYRYWEARLKESFHFDPVRQLAQQRFAAAQLCMKSLEIEDIGQDFTNITLESLS